MPLTYDDAAAFAGLDSIEKPKKKSTGNIDAFLESEGATHLKPVVEAIYGQESGSGRTHATSIDGARGQMQVMPATFKRLAREGENVDNPDDNMRVGIRYIKMLGDKFGNDPARIAAGYFSGEGNVNTAGDTPYKFDRADGNKKTVSSYVKDVMGRIGNAVIPSAQAKEIDGMSLAKQIAGGGEEDSGLALAREIAGAGAPEPETTAAAPSAEPGLLDKAKKLVGWNEGRNFKAPEGVTDATFSAGIPEGQVEPKSNSSVMAGYKTDTQAPSKNISPMTESGEAKVRGMLKDQPDEKLLARAEQGGVIGQVASQMLVERGTYRNKLAGNEVPTVTEDAQAGVNPKRWNQDRQADANREYLQRNKAAVMDYLVGAQRLAPADAAGEYERMLQQGVVPNRDGLDNTRPEAGYGDVLAVGATRAKAGLGRGYMGLGEWVGDAFGIDAVSKFSSASASGYEKDFKTAADDVMGRIPQKGFKALVAETAPSIISQVPGILAAGLATAISKNPAALEGILSAAMLTPMGAQVFGESYRDGKSAGLSLADNTAYSAGKALAEVLPERLSLGAMFKFLGGINKGTATQIAASFLGQQVTEHTTEQITTVAQFLLDRAYTQPDLSLKDLEAQMVQTFQATALQAPILVAMGGGATMAGRGGLALRDKLDPTGAAFRQLDSNIENAQFAGVDKAVRDSLNPNVTDETVAVPEAQGFAPTRQQPAAVAGDETRQQPAAVASPTDPENPLGGAPITSPIASELASIEGLDPDPAIGGTPASKHNEQSLSVLATAHPDPVVREQATSALQQKQAESLNVDPETEALVRRVTNDASATVVPETALPAATGGRSEGLTRESADVIRSIYELSGTTPVWYDASGAEGFVLPQRSTKQVFLNARKGSITPLAVAGHEVFHSIEADSPDLFGSFRTVVDRVSNIDLSNDDGLLAYAQTYAPGVFNGKTIEGMRAAGKTSSQILDTLIPEIGDGYTRDLVRNEFYNDVFGNRWSEPGFYKSLIKELARTDVGLLQRFKGALDMVVQKVQGMSGANFAADQFLKDIEPVRQEAARVYAAYASRQGFRDKIAKMTPAELLFTKKNNPDEIARDLAEQELKRREIEGAYAELEAQKKAEKEKFKEANKEAKLEQAEAEAKAAGTDDGTPTNMKQALAAAKPDKQAIRKQLAKAAATARGKAQVRAEQLEDNEQGRFSPARETAADHKMQITREERELADKTKLTREELKRITASAMQFGLKPRVVEMEVRRIKARFPEAAGWAPLEFNRVDPKTVAKKAKPGNPLPSDAIFFVEQGYKFHLGPKETQASRIKQLASALAGEITTKYVAAQNGDPVAKVIMRQSDWYQALRGKLRATFGGFGDFLAQLLGPTSANNPVEPNFKYGVEALKLATSGKWDNLFKDIFAWRADIDAAAAALDSTIATVQAEGGKGVMKDPRVVAAMAELKKASVYKGESPRRENGKQFGMASKGIEQILAETWGDKVRGDAPKTKNYYQNIMGRTLEATIDVWAARTLRRLANEAIGDFPRIPPVAETAVAGNVLADNATSGSEFGFGQDVFREAAAQLRNSGIEQFKNTTPDAVQAMIWFAEKELWARRDWTTKVGEEGSIEHEMLLAGYPDRKQVDAWRVAARAGHPNPDTQAFQGKDGKLRTAAFEKAVAKWKEAKAIAADALSKIEKYPDRFVAGVTTEIPGGKPTDKEMAKTARELEAAIADDKVIAVRVVSSTGEFMGDFERTLDTEFVVRNGYDATPSWNKLVEIGEREGQQAVFLSRVLREDEKPAPLTHRPGVELYFTKPISLEDAKPLMDTINAAGVHGMTMATEGRRTPGALEGKDQPIAGIRMQHIPEFMLGYGYNVSMTDAEIAASITAARDKMEDLVEQLSTRGDVATAKAHWYETRVHFYGNQDAKTVAGREPGTGAGEVWSGQRISEALKGADRFARNGEASLAARRAELRQLSRRDPEEGSSGQDVRLSPNRDDLGSLRAPGYGTGQKGSVSKLGVHFSKAERSSLSGAHYGQGMKGAEKERLLRESGAPGQQHRIHYYVDEGQGIRPESDVGDHAHATQLNNLYDWNDDPLNLWPAARARYQDPADRFNHVEQQIIARGFDGVYAAEAQGSQGVAVLLGTKHKSVPVQYAGRGYRGGEAVEQAPKPKAEPKRADLPMGKMTGAEWKKLEPRATELEDDKSYYRDAVRFSPARFDAIAEAFAGRVGAALANPRNTQSVLIHNSTPASMQILGWSNRRLLVEASELAKIANKPGFETDDKIGDLVRDLGRPGAMFWNDKQGSLNILRRADMRGAPALIAIRPDVKTGTTARDHLLVTAHRLDSQDALLRKITSGELKPLYLDQANPVIKEAMQKKKYQVVVGESLAPENLHARTDKKLGTASRLLSPDDLVKWETENWGDNPKFSPPRAQTETPEFKAWYEGSNLRNADGSPVVLYHGTNKDFSRFGISKTGAMGPGVYLGDDPEVANAYSEGAGANVMPVYARGRYLSNREWSSYVRDNGWEKGREKAIEEGVAGVWDQKFESAVLVFDPANIKSAIGNNGQFDPANPDIRYSPPRFYSQLQRAFEQAPDRVFGPAAQVKAWLASNAGKMGVKQDEVQWSGINDWLDLQGKQKISKDQVVQYLQQNGVQVTEVEKGKAGFDEDNPQLPEYSPLEVMESDEEYHGEMARRYKYVVIDTEADTTKGFGHTRQEAISDAHSGHPSYWDREGSTKYHGYTLPGGESYRELLLTLPRREAEFTIPSDVKIKYEGEGSFAAYQGGEWIGSYPTRAEATEAMEKRFGTAKDFKSSHWDEKNILAHVRFNDRTDADGKKVLFIEEVQSDWGQQGKKKGFDPVSKIEGLTMTGIPLAPFVTDTKAWAGLAIKRMVAYAAENGYDKVAFVNGQQSSERYDLSERVKSISYATNKDGTFAVNVRGLDGKDVWASESATPESLEDVVGKEIVERIVRNEGHETGAPKGSGELSGNGLKVGSQGMVAFYDKILPQVVNDVLKKVGGGKLEKVTLAFHNPAEKAFDSDKARAFHDISKKVWDRMSVHEQNELINEYWKQDTSEQLGFSVTPAMRDKVAEGLPLFSPLRKVADAINSTITRVDAAVDGLSHLPDQFDYLSDRYLALGKIARVDEIITEIRGSFDKMPQADKAAVYAYLTTRGAPLSMIGNPEGRAMAKRVKDVINYVGDALVARGLLDPASRAKYKDQYLPRLYLKHLMSEEAWKLIGGGKKPSDMGYLKERKDIPPEVRELVLGEIKDPAFLAANAIGRAMRDVALLDWMGRISQHNDWTYPGVFVNYRGQRVTSYWLKAEADRITSQIPHYTPANQVKAKQLVDDMRLAASTANLEHLDHTKFKQVPDTIRYGMLRGMWLRKEIYNDIMGSSQIANADPNWFEDWFGFGGKGTRLTQWWKFSKVALNPPGQVRNFISNMVMLQLSGVGLHKLPFRLIQAAREITSNGRHWQIAKKYGVTESTFTAQELYRVKRDLVMLENGAGRMNPLAWLTNVGAHFLDKVGNLYQFSEALGKVIKIIDEMENGKTEAEAAIEAQKWLFDYSLVPQSVRIARNSPVGLPFLCVADDTEILTKGGWRNADTVKVGDWAATMDTKTGRLTWRLIADVYRSDYEGEMIHVKDRHLDMLMTPNHGVVTYRRRRVPGKRATGEKYMSLEVVHAENLTTSDHIPVAAPFDHVPEGESLPDALVEVIGWYVTEGHEHTKCDAVFISQNEGAKASRIRRALTEAGITFREATNQRDTCIQFYIHAEHGRRLRALCPGKQLPAGILQRLSVAQIALLVQTMIDGDGHTSKDGRQVFIQKENETLDTFQAALTLIGKGWNVRDHGGGTKAVLIKGADRYCVKRATRDRVQYKGRIWCPEVMGTGTWVARRNGKVFITHNTYQIKVLPRLLEVATKHPWRFLPWVGLLYGMQAYVASLFGADDDDMEKLKKSLPQWLQERGHTVFLPNKDDNGRIQVADVGYFFPWSFYSQVGKHAAEGDVKKAVLGDLGGLFSAPIIGAGAALMSNYDNFTKKPIYNEGDPKSYQAAAVANYVYDLMAPPFISSHGFASPMGFFDKQYGGKMVQALSGTTNKFGDLRATEGQALAGLLGFNFYGMDPEHTRVTNMAQMVRKVQDAERRLKTRMVDQGLTEAQRVKYIEDYRERMLELGEEARKYAEESEIPEQLKVKK